jgi:hypothetical protein
VIKMGRSTVNELIQRAKSMNDYNNSGIETMTAWVDFFNEALTNMVDDLGLEEVLTINFVQGTTEYDLPEDYYGMITVTEADTGTQMAKRRAYPQKYPYGWWVLDKGSKTVLDLIYNFNKAFKVHYNRYPAKLELGTIATQKPEVPTTGETALCYKAINRALLNNNQFEQAAVFEKLYKDERANIRTASIRARGV